MTDSKTDFSPIFFTLLAGVVLVWAGSRILKLLADNPYLPAPPKPRPDDRAVRQRERELLMQINVIHLTTDMLELAKSQYLSEPKLPGYPSITGVNYGMLSAWRHFTSNNALDLQIAPIKYALSNDAALDHAAALVQSASLWNEDNSFNHAFPNFFLVMCRLHDIQLYKEVVYRSHGVAFTPNGAYTLYRRDSRDEHLIFREGFQLKNNEHNAATSRKSNYCEPFTYDYGVSFSKKIPPTYFGSTTSYFEIRLPNDHNLLLIDICESPRNEGKLLHERLELLEVNSCDNIPTQFIAGVHIQLSGCCSGFFRPNPNYNPNYVVQIRKDVQMRGCM